MGASQYDCHQKFPEAAERDSALAYAINKIRYFMHEYSRRRLVISNNHHLQLRFDAPSLVAYDTVFTSTEPDVAASPMLQSSKQFQHSIPYFFDLAFPFVLAPV